MLQPVGIIVDEGGCLSLLAVDLMMRMMVHDDAWTILILMSDSQSLWTSCTTIYPEGGPEGM